MSFFLFPLKIISCFSFHHNHLSVHELNLSKLEMTSSSFSIGFSNTTQFIFGFDLSKTTCLPLVWVSGPKDTFLKNVRNCLSFLLFHVPHLTILNGSSGPELENVATGRPGGSHCSLAQVPPSLPGKPEHPFFLVHSHPASSGNKTLNPA